MAAEGLTAIPSLLSSLPQILDMISLFAYVVLALFLGGIAVKGFRKNVSLAPKILIIIALGAVSLFGGASLSVFFPQLNTGLLALMHAGIIVGGLISSLILMAGLFMLTHGLYRGRNLWQEIDMLKDALVRSHSLKHIPLSEAKGIAQRKIKGMKAFGGEMDGSDWRVYLKKGKKEICVIVDSLSGDVKAVLRHPNPIVNYFMSPVKIVGLVVIVLFIIIAAMNFTGLPDTKNEFFEFIGITPGQLESLGTLGSDMNFNIPLETPEGCESIISVLQSVTMENIESYEHAGVRNMIENGSGKTVSYMVSMDYQGELYIIAYTDDKFVCTSKIDMFCECASFEI
jgi:hypothetical protein